jgi:iron complex transport system permease protein
MTISATRSVSALNGEGLPLSPVPDVAPPTVHPTRLKASYVFWGVTFLVVAAIASILVGPADLSPESVFRALMGGPRNSSLAANVVWQLRMPRVVLGGLVGAMLAVAGAAYQGVFFNPLADPYLLGIASGAGLGATVAIVDGPQLGHLPAGAVQPFAFAGAVLAVLATFGLGRTRSRERSIASLVLAGVAVAAFFTAVQTFLLQRSSSIDLTAVYDWVLGHLATAGWSQVVQIAPYVGVSLAVLVAVRRLLDVLAVGDDEASSLGVHAGRTRLAVVAAATLGTAAAVSVSGLIGFVGIIVPHTIRLVTGPSYRRILPLAVLFGAGFLILADLLARTVLSPGEVPLGVVTAFLGAPFFLVVLRQATRTS